MILAYFVPQRGLLRLPRPLLATVWLALSLWLGSLTATQAQAPTNTFAVGLECSLTIRPDGTLWAWGLNMDGQLGDGTTTPRYSPVQIGTATNWQSISVGNTSVLAIRTDGTLWGWGSNGYGQLGNGTTTTQLTPMQIGTATNWQSVSVGTASAIATRTDGTLWAWGGVSRGTSPVQIGTATWRAVSCGGVVALGVRADGTLWTWPNVTTQPVPTQVGTESTWRGVAAGSNHYLALRQDGTLWAWGTNTSGQLGDGTTTARTTPVQVGTATNWQSVSVGTASTSATRTDGTLWGWGFNGSGQLGDETTLDRLSPVQIGTATSWARTSLGYSSHALAARTDGSLWAWGSNSYGQTGTTDSSFVTNRQPWQVGRNATWQQVYAGERYSLGLRQDGTLWSWGNNTVGRGLGATIIPNSPQQVAPGTTWRNIAVGEVRDGLRPNSTKWFVRAIRSDGTLWTWGDNTNGQLGTGTRVIHYSPVQLSAATTWVSVADWLALQQDGSLWIWNYTSSTTPATYVLTQISGTTGMNWRSISGYLAVRADGTLWSVNYTASPPVMVQVGTATNWQSISISAGSQISVHTDGTLWAWGRNTSGQLGNGTATDIANPVQIGTATNWRSASIGNSHSTAVRTDGTLWAWGDNYYGQLGNGTQVSSLTPTQVGTRTNWQSTSTGTLAHTMAIQTDGSLWGWGGNTGEELGYPNYFVRPRLISQVLITSARAAAGRSTLAVYPTLLRPGQPLHYSLDVAARAGAELTLYTPLGQRVATYQLGAGRTGTVALGTLAAGWYVARLRQPDGSTATTRFAVY